MRAAATRSRTTSRTVKAEWRKGYKLIIEQRNMDPASAAK